MDVDVKVVKTKTDGVTKKPSKSELKTKTKTATKPAPVRKGGGSR